MDNMMAGQIIFDIGMIFSIVRFGLDLRAEFKARQQEREKAIREWERLLSQVKLINQRLTAIEKRLSH